MLQMYKRNQYTEVHVIKVEKLNNTKRRVKIGQMKGFMEAFGLKSSTYITPSFHFKVLLTKSMV